MQCTWSCLRCCCVCLSVILITPLKRWASCTPFAQNFSFYVNDEPGSKFLYTETIKLYCIVLYSSNCSRVAIFGWVGTTIAQKCLLYLNSLLSPSPQQVFSLCFLSVIVLHTLLPDTRFFVRMQVCPVPLNSQSNSLSFLVNLLFILFGLSSRWRRQVLSCNRSPLLRTVHTHTQSRMSMITLGLSNIM